MDSPTSDETPALRALADSGIGYAVTRHGRVRSLAEAAEARGVPPRSIVKTMVVRRGAGDHLFVLVPGDREISWPKLRAVLGVNRISMPDAEVAREVTGYERGTITPFGSATALPVIVDERIAGSVGSAEQLPQGSRRRTPLGTPTPTRPATSSPASTPRAWPTTTRSTTTSWAWPTSSPPASCAPSPSASTDRVQAGSVTSATCAPR